MVRIIKDSEHVMCHVYVMTVAKGLIKLMFCRSIKAIFSRTYKFYSRELAVQGNRIYDRFCPKTKQIFIKF